MVGLSVFLLIGIIAILAVFFYFVPFLYGFRHEYRG